MMHELEKPKIDAGQDTGAHEIPSPTFSSNSLFQNRNSRPKNAALAKKYALPPLGFESYPLCFSDSSQGAVISLISSNTHLYAGTDKGYILKYKFDCSPPDIQTLDDKGQFDLPSAPLSPSSSPTHPQTLHVPQTSHSTSLDDINLVLNRSLSTTTAIPSGVSASLGTNTIHNISLEHTIHAATFHTNIITSQKQTTKMKQRGKRHISSKSLTNSPDTIDDIGSNPMSLPAPPATLGENSFLPISKMEHCAFSNILFVLCAEVLCIYDADSLVLLDYLHSGIVSLPKTITSTTGQYALMRHNAELKHEESSQAQQKAFHGTQKHPKHPKSADEAQDYTNFTEMSSTLPWLQTDRELESCVPVKVSLFSHFKAPNGMVYILTGYHKKMLLTALLKTPAALSAVMTSDSFNVAGFTNGFSPTTMAHGNHDVRTQPSDEMSHYAHDPIAPGSQLSGSKGFRFKSLKGFTPSSFRHDTISHIGITPETLLQHSAPGSVLKGSPHESSFPDTSPLASRLNTTNCGPLIYKSSPSTSTSTSTSTLAPTTTNSSNGPNNSVPEPSRPNTTWLRVTNFDQTNFHLDAGPIPTTPGSSLTKEFGRSVSKYGSQNIQDSIGYWNVSSLSAAAFAKKRQTASNSTSPSQPDVTDDLQSLQKLERSCIQATAKIAKYEKAQSSPTLQSLKDGRLDLTSSRNFSLKDGVSSRAQFGAFPSLFHLKMHLYQTECAEYLTDGPNLNSLDTTPILTSTKGHPIHHSDPDFDLKHASHELQTCERQQLDEKDLHSDPLIKTSLPLPIRAIKSGSRHQSTSQPHQETPEKEKSSGQPSAAISPPPNDKKTEDLDVSRNRPKNTIMPFADPYFLNHPFAGYYSNVKVPPHVPKFTWFTASTSLYLPESILKLVLIDTNHAFCVFPSASLLMNLHNSSVEKAVIPVPRNTHPALTRIGGNTLLVVGENKSMLYSSVPVPQQNLASIASSPSFFPPPASGSSSVMPASYPEPSLDFKGKASPRTLHDVVPGQDPTGSNSLNSSMIYDSPGSFPANPSSMSYSGEVPTLQPFPLMQQDQLPGSLDTHSHHVPQHHYPTTPSQIDPPVMMTSYSTNSGPLSNSNRVLLRATCPLNFPTVPFALVSSGSFLLCYFPTTINVYHISRPSTSHFPQFSFVETIPFSPLALTSLSLQATSVITLQNALFQALYTLHEHSVPFSYSATALNNFSSSLSVTNPTSMNDYSSVVPPLPGSHHPTQAHTSNGASTHHTHAINDSIVNAALQAAQNQSNALLAIQSLSTLQALTSTPSAACVVCDGPKSFVFASRYSQICVYVPIQTRAKLLEGKLIVLRQRLYEQILQSLPTFESFPEMALPQLEAAFEIYLYNALTRTLGSKNHPISLMIQRCVANVHSKIHAAWSRLVKDIYLTNHQSKKLLSKVESGALLEPPSNTNYQSRLAMYRSYIDKRHEMFLSSLSSPSPSSSSSSSSFLTDSTNESDHIVACAVCSIFSQLQKETTLTLPSTLDDLNDSPSASNASSDDLKPAFTRSATLSNAPTKYIVNPKCSCVGIFRLGAGDIQLSELISQRAGQAIENTKLEIDTQVKRLSGVLTTSWGLPGLECTSRMTEELLSQYVHGLLYPALRPYYMELFCVQDEILLLRTYVTRSKAFSDHGTKIFKIPKHPVHAEIEQSLSTVSSSDFYRPMPKCPVRLDDADSKETFDFFESGASSPIVHLIRFVNQTVLDEKLTSLLHAHDEIVRQAERLWLHRRTQYAKYVCELYSWFHINRSKDLVSNLQGDLPITSLNVLQDKNDIALTEGSEQDSVVSISCKDSLYPQPLPSPASSLSSVGSISSLYAPSMSSQNSVIADDAIAAHQTSSSGLMGSSKPTRPMNFPSQTTKHEYGATFSHSFDNEHAELQSPHPSTNMSSVYEPSLGSLDLDTPRIATELHGDDDPMHITFRPSSRGLSYIASLKPYSHLFSFTTALRGGMKTHLDISLKFFNSIDANLRTNIYSPRSFLQDVADDMSPREDTNDMHQSKSAFSFVEKESSRKSSSSSSTSSSSTSFTFRDPINSNDAYSRIRERELLKISKSLSSTSNSTSHLPTCPAFGKCEETEQLSTLTNSPRLRSVIDGIISKRIILGDVITIAVFFLAAILKNNVSPQEWDSLEISSLMNALQISTTTDLSLDIKETILKWFPFKSENIFFDQIDQYFRSDHVVNKIKNKDTDKNNIASSSDDLEINFSNITITDVADQLLIIAIDIYDNIYKASKSDYLEIEDDNGASDTALDMIVTTFDFLSNKHVSITPLNTLSDNNNNSSNNNNNKVLSWNSLPADKLHNSFRSLPPSHVGSFHSSAPSSLATPTSSFSTSNLLLKSLSTDSGIYVPDILTGFPEADSQNTPKNVSMEWRYGSTHEFTIPFIQLRSFANDISSFKILIQMALMNLQGEMEQTFNSFQSQDISSLTTPTNGDSSIHNAIHNTKSLPLPTGSLSSTPSHADKHTDKHPTGSSKTSRRSSAFSNDQTSSGSNHQCNCSCLVETDPKPVTFPFDKTAENHDHTASDVNGNATPAPGSAMNTTNAAHFKTIEKQIIKDIVGTKRFIMAADDLVPCLCLCLAHASSPHLIAELNLLTDFLPYKEQNGKIGYALTTTVIASQHLLSQFISPVSPNAEQSSLTVVNFDPAISFLSLDYFTSAMKQQDVNYNCIFPPNHPDYDFLHTTLFSPSIRRLLKIEARAKQAELLKRRNASQKRRNVVLSDSDDDDDDDGEGIELLANPNLSIKDESHKPVSQPEKLITQHKMQSDSSHPEETNPVHPSPHMNGERSENDTDTDFSSSMEDNNPVTYGHPIGTNRVYHPSMNQLSSHPNVQQTRRMEKYFFIEYYFL